MQRHRLLIFGSVIVVLVVVAFLFFGRHREDGSVPGGFFEERYTKDDDFYGPPAGAHSEDRDGVFNSLTVSPTDADTVFVGTENNGIFRSDDGGQTWEWQRTGLWHDERSYPEVYDMAFAPDGETIAAALTNGPQPPDIERSAGFYHSDDGGRNWTRSVTGLPNTGATSVAFHPTDSETIFLGLDGEDPSNHRLRGRRIPGGLYRSRDGGRNWEPLPVPGRGIYNKYNRIVVRGERIFTSGLRWRETESGTHRDIDPEHAVSLIRSDDAGVTWEAIGPPGTFCYYFDVSADGNSVYFTDGVSGRAFRSHDGGETWQKMTLSFSNAVAVSPHDSLTVLFANGPELYKSTDGLETMHRVFGRDEGGFDDIVFSPTDPGIVYAAGDGYRVYRSDDAGETFSQIADLRAYIEREREGKE